MNRIILEHGIKTTTNLSTSIKDSSNLEPNLDTKQDRIVVDASKLNHGVRVKSPDIREDEKR